MIIVSGKVYLNTQEFNPSAFLEDSACLDICGFYHQCVITAHTSGLIKFDRFVVQAFHILKGLIKCKVIELLTPEKERTTKLQQAKEKRLLFWTDARVAEFTEIIILRYLPFTQEELETWKQQPEEFLAIEEEDNPTNTLRVTLLVLNFLDW